jgi:hypothetical protein
MTRHSIRMFTALVSAVLWFAGVAQAQYVPHLVRVRAPFEFTFRDKQFSAGDYVMACTPVAVELRTPLGEVVATGIPHAVESRELMPAKLVFADDGNDHVLSQIWPGTSRYGYEFAHSRPITLLAKQRSHRPIAVASGGNK